MNYFVLVESFGELFGSFEALSPVNPVIFCNASDFLPFHWESIGNVICYLHLSEGGPGSDP